MWVLIVQSERGIGGAQQHKAFFHLGIIQEGLIFLINFPFYNLANAARSKPQPGRKTVSSRSFSSAASRM